MLLLLYFGRKMMLISLGGAKQQKAFDEIKSYLTSPPVLQAPKSGILSRCM
jgi:hypothetical protein